MDYHSHHPSTIVDAQPPKPPNIGQPTTKKSLGLLAEVAITRLIEEQKNEAMSSKTKIISRNYSLKQIRKLSEKKLLMTFAEKLKRVVDKNQKLFSYKCQILPQECQMKLECYARDENEIKTRMVNHLLGHLCNLEKSVPNIKIPSNRKVKSRNRSSAPKTSTTSPTTARKSSTKKPNSKLPESTSFTIQQSVATATPIDMTITTTTTNNSNVNQLTTQLPLDDKKRLVLKFLEEDHTYTMPTAATKSSAIQLQSTVADSIQLINMNEALTVATHRERSNIPETNELQHKSVITTFIPAANMPQTIDLRTSSNQTIITAVGTTTTTTTAVVTQPQLTSTPTTQAQTIRALALDYIDDIRKKSSSAAKSIIVNGDKSLVYQCKICPDKQFTSTNGLIFHYKKHAGLKPYVCDLCSATFTRQHSLNYHMLIHLNKSRFVCQECGRHFRHPSHFKEHMRRHTGETPFQCGDCLIRFKTRNTYKRHLQTKHSKILTSKGIIELSITQGQALSTPHQSLPKIQPTNGQTVTTTIPVATVPTTTSGAIKPRRKYGMRYLHKNIETINKYEQQLTPVVGSQVPIDYSQHAPNLAIQGTHSNNITIVSIPQLSTMNAVHILDNAGSSTNRISKPLVDLTDNVNYQQPNANQAITLVSYQPSPVVPLEPIQPTSLVNTPPMPISSGQLTELTSSPAIMVAAGSAAHDYPGEAMLQHHQTGGIQQQQQQPPPLPPPQSNGNNDNFMRLLEAIAMTEDS
ncbi:hypothetical protein BLOT_009166 [Blomia tropicalis]|nr:hypothetical protein BLOT_009166 [Blomia tropicalis]